MASSLFLSLSPSKKRHYRANNGRVTTHIKGDETDSQSHAHSLGRTAVRPRDGEERAAKVQPPQLLGLPLEKGLALLERLTGGVPGVARRLEGAGAGDAAPRAQALGRVLGEERGGAGDERVEVHVGGDAAEDDLEQVGLVDVENLGAAVDDDLGKDVDAEDGLAGEQHVKEAGNVAVRVNVVGVHGQGAGEGVKGLDGGDVPQQGRVRGGEDVWEQAQLRRRGPEVGQHEVADAQHREARDAGGRPRRPEHEQEHLAYVVVALKVAQVGARAQHLRNQGRQLASAPLQVALGEVCWWRAQSESEELDRFGPAWDRRLCMGRLITMGVVDKGSVHV